MNILLEAAIGAIATKGVSDWMAKRGKTDSVVDPIPKAAPTNAQPQQPIAASVRDTESMVAYPVKTPWIGHLANGPQQGDPVPGTAQIISAPSIGTKSRGTTSTKIFAAQTDPADAGNVSQINRTSFYVDPITFKRIPTGISKPAGTSGGVYMLMAEHAGTPAETVNDPQTAHVQASLAADAPTLAPGVRPLINGLNPTQKIPIGAKWAELSNV
jgi:hypothetical protein